MSARRTRILGAIAGLLALAVLALWLLHAGPLPPERTTNPLPPSPLATAPDSPASASPAAAAPAPLGEAPPPWSAPPRRGPASPVTTDPHDPAAAATARSAALSALQQQLLEISASQAPDPQKLDRLLGEVERVQGSSTIGGVKIDVLRHNLAIAQQMQALATDIQQLSSRGAQADPKQLQAQMARIVELQAQLRTDVLAAPVAVPAPVER